MDIQLVKANINDVKTLANIHITAWKQAYKNIIPESYLQSLSIEAREESFRNDMLTNNNLEFYFIKDSLHNIGIVILTKNKINKTSELTALYLLEEYHHKGIGTIIMNTVKTIFSNDNYNKITLWVLKDNHNAIKFYKKHNFIPSGNTKTIVCGKELEEVEYTYRIER